MMRCEAKSKQSGEQCKRNASIGSTKCAMHGGKTPKGIASTHFKTGRYSKHLPVGLLDAYQDTLNDPELLSVRGDIHLIDTLLLSKLQNLDTGESAQHWIALVKHIIEARKALRSEDYGELTKRLDEMEALADKRRLHYATEEEILLQVEQRRKLVETEQGMSLKKERAITAEQAMLLISAMLDSVKRNVTDVSALTAIQADFIQFIGGTRQVSIDSTGGS